MAGRKHVARIVVGIALAMGIAAALVLYVRERGSDESFVLSGTIEAHSARVGSVTGGRIARILVVEGDRVTTGQRIAEIETDQIDLQIAEQQSAIASAEAQVKNLEEGPRQPEIDRAAVIAASAETDRRRFDQLYREGVVSKSELDSRTALARTTAKELQLLEAGTRPNEIEAARAQLEQARARLASIEQQKTESKVEAPFGGVVQSIAVRPGDLVAPNQPVAELIQDSELWVRAFVPATEVGLVTLGMPAAVAVDSHPGRRFAGRVTQIDTRGEYTPRNVQTRKQRADQVFGFKVTLDADPILKPGMAADIDLSSGTEPR